MAFNALRHTGAATALALILAAQPLVAQEAETAADAAEAPAEALGDISAETPVATLNGMPVTLGQVIAVRRALPEQYQSLPPEVLMGALTEQVISQTLMAEAARAEGLDRRADVRLAIENQVQASLADAYMRTKLQERITPEAVEAAYEARYAEAEPVEQVRAAHILVETEEKAAELKAELDTGADFAELAAEHGTDGTATRGGDLGWFEKADMVPAFADAAFAMEVGTISDPVQSPFGFHLIKLDGRRDKPVPPLEEVREEIVSGLVSDAQSAIIESVRSDAEIGEGEAVPPQLIFADELLDAAE